MVGEAELYSFNLPFYAPYKDEVKAIAEEEGSFTLDKFELFGVDRDEMWPKPLELFKNLCWQVILDLETLKWAICLRGLQITLLSI